MGRVLVNSSTLTSIADAIRLKAETTETYKPAEMPAAIMTLGSSQDDIDALAQALHFEGECDYLFYNGKFDNLINNYGNLITTSAVDRCSYMFYRTTVKSIPFDINLIKDSTFRTNITDYMFAGSDIEIAPAIKGKIKTENIERMYSSCASLRDGSNISFDFLDNSADNLRKANHLFYQCYSLRNIPETALNNLYTWSSSASEFQYAHTYEAFHNCYALDEIKGLNTYKGNAFTSNAFTNAFAQCGRLKEVQFAPDAIERIWKNQTITLTSVGYNKSIGEITNHNSGITADKEVKDTATYNALKNSPDWFTLDYKYSRYNHDSAVNTINSLPKMLSGSSGNTIKFKGDMGSLTDGGAINTLTEEEIAVATAKGWTVSFS